MARGDKGTKRRDHIIDEATRLFAERGYAGASMADLAERVGLRKASLFHHFPSKEQLYAAVLERPIADVGVAIGRALEDTNRSFEDRLDDLSYAFVGVMGAQPYAARLFVREVMQWSAGEASPLSQAIDGVLAGATTFLEEGQRTGNAPAADARQIIVSLIGLHLMPYTIPGVVERFTQADPFSAAGLEQRRVAVRDQVRGMVLRR